MSAIVSQLADAVVTALNAHTFSRTVTAVRTYRPDHKLEDLQTVKVAVAPKTVTRHMETRARDTLDCQIDVAVQQSLPGNDAALLSERLPEADALLGLVEEIQDFLARAAFAVAGQGTWKVVRIDGNPIYHPDHWDTLQCFTAISTLTLAGTKGVA